MQMIVAGYVKVRDRRALTDLLAHRRKVLTELQAVSGYQSGERSLGRPGRDRHRVWEETRNPLRDRPSGWRPREKPQIAPKSPLTKYVLYHA